MLLPGPPCRNTAGTPARLPHSSKCNACGPPAQRSVPCSKDSIGGNRWLNRLAPGHKVTGARLRRAARSRLVLQFEHDRQCYSELAALAQGSVGLKLLDEKELIVFDSEAAYGIELDARL